MIELAGIQDKKELQNLWQATFLEDYSVTEKFFNNIFSDVITPVIKVDGKIISSLFLLNCKIGSYKGKCVYCAMTKYSHRGKGYMKQLLDFSYNYCKNNGFDFLFLVPADNSLFDYYTKCGFENFGISRKVVLTDKEPTKKEKLNYNCEIQFDNSILEYWQNSCVIYGGIITDFGLAFDDGNLIIRNAKGDFDDILENYKKSGVIVQGDITFGDDYSPAMIKTENKYIKNSRCYIGVTLE